MQSWGKFKVAVLTLCYSKADLQAARRMVKALRRDGFVIHAVNVDGPFDETLLQNSTAVIAAVSPDAYASLTLRHIARWARRSHTPLLPVIVEPVPGFSNHYAVDASTHFRAGLKTLRQRCRRWQDQPRFSPGRWLHGAIAAIVVFITFALLIMAVTHLRGNADAIQILPTAAVFDLEEPGEDGVTTSSKQSAIAAFVVPQINIPDHPTRNADDDSPGDQGIDTTGDGSTVALTAPEATEAVTDQPAEETSQEEPVASFVAAPAAGNAPLTVMFLDYSEGAITAYAWDFDGDDTTDSTAANPPAYTFTSPGQYTVALTVSGKDGEVSTDSAIITVYAVGSDDETSVPTEEPTAEPTENSGGLFDDEPIASFYANPPDGNAPLVVSFRNDTLGSPLSYAWDLNGDGITDHTSASPGAFTFNAPGEYEPSLTVTGPNGYQDTYTGYISVYETVTDTTKPVAAFSVDPNSGPAPLTITFNNETTGQILTYFWDFDGDGQVDYKQANPPTYTYNQPGTYQVALRVFSPAGISAPKVITVTVNEPAPTEAVTPEPTEVPTVIPTEEPTAAITEAATVIPTEAPTEAVTEIPTETPTVPTEEPTAAVTAVATALPTEAATVIPTEEPTAAVTEVPTEMPTVVPTEEPTAAVTEAATALPTEAATEIPTIVPTEEPTTAIVQTPDAEITPIVTVEATPEVTATEEPKIPPARGILQPGHYEEDHAELFYRGAWFPLNHESATLMGSTTPNDHLLFIINGAGLQIHRMVGPGMGTMQACVNTICLEISNEATVMAIQPVLLELNTGIYEVELRPTFPGTLQLDALTVYGETSTLPTVEPTAVVTPPETPITPSPEITEVVTVTPAPEITEIATIPVVVPTLDDPTPQAEPPTLSAPETAAPEATAAVDTP